ncbi:MAG: GNAT family N-acetyltransferase [Coriobacteriaceae bacterium]|nr:GNAT family N-acetyltransferase [Coriobacteriaceae bacterium]
MVIETERLILRPWEDSDAEALYKYASDPEVGPAAGWPVHTSVQMSREVIRDVLSAPETYAIVLRETAEPVGSIGLMKPRLQDVAPTDHALELGYWIGKPYWGRGLVSEAAQAVIARAFSTLGAISSGARTMTATGSRLACRRSSALFLITSRTMVVSSTGRSIAAARGMRERADELRRFARVALPHSPR